MFKKASFLLPVLILVLAACGPKTMSGSPTPEMMMHDTPTPEMMMHDTPTPEMMMHDTATPDAMMHDTATPETGGAGMMAPDWYSASLSDVASGSPFSISTYSGKVVLVETMAMWCPTCRSQQQQIAALLQQLGMHSDLVAVSLDIDPNENAADLKAYVTQSGFDWYHAIASSDVSHQIGQLYGDQFLNPPSTPILIIDRHGEAHPLPFGLKNADDLLKAITPYLNDGM
jgi:thiol-disulfide isomerase/thioredoxin